MAFKMTGTDWYRVSNLGIAFVLTISELALLAVFTRHTISQGSIPIFEIVGLVTSSLTLLLLPVLIICPLIAPNAPFSLLPFEISVLVILSGLWLGFVILEENQRHKWYPVPKAYQHQEGVSGCQFVPEGQEVYWCQQLGSNSVLTVIILFLVLVYTLSLLVLSLLYQKNGTPFWTKTLNDYVGPDDTTATAAATSSTCSTFNLSPKSPNYSYSAVDGRRGKGLTFCLKLQVCRMGAITFISVSP